MIAHAGNSLPTRSQFSGRYVHHPSHGLSLANTSSICALRVPVFPVFLFTCGRSYSTTPARCCCICAVYVQMSAFKHLPSGYLSCNSNISTPGHLCSDPIRKIDPTSKEQNPARRADVPSISPLPLPRPSVSYPESCK